MHPDSDLDVLAVADDADDRWLDDLGSLGDATMSWTGNDTRPLVLTPNELTSERDAVLVEIGRDAQVLFGEPAFLRHARRPPQMKPRGQYGALAVPWRELKTSARALDALVAAACDG